MQVFFKFRQPEAAELRELARHRLLFVFRRLARRIRTTTVAFADVNGPRGGMDKLCRVQVKADGAEPLVATAVAHDWHTALHEASSRAARLVARLYERGGEPRRARQRAVAFGR